MDAPDTKKMHEKTNIKLFLKINKLNFKNYEKIKNEKQTQAFKRIL